ncbi:50S ribosomal protein L17 [Candidatus Woesebacteria bacterium]|nr:50S ribosomal protein L17 [Candidatus Woesebacteria bacterium]
MKKRKIGIKLSRGQAARKALFRSLIGALVERGSIETTETKAKAIEGKIAKLVISAKNDNVTSRRKIYSFFGNNRKITDELFDIVKKNFSKRNAGFTRIVKLPTRRGDGARMVNIEWVKDKTTLEKEPKKEKQVKNVRKQIKSKK